MAASMLEEAHALARRGVDVVLAFVETHGRAETEALLGDLEVVPRLEVEYRAVVVEEMDLDAVLARSPAVAVVDELPHTDVPGSRNRRRYQTCSTCSPPGSTSSARSTSSTSSR